MKCALCKIEYEGEQFIIAKSGWRLKVCKGCYIIHGQKIGNTMDKLEQMRIGDRT